MRIAFTYHPFNIKWNHGCAVLAALCQRAGIDAVAFPLFAGFTGEGFDAVCVSFVTVHDYKASQPFLQDIVVPKYAGGVYARKGGNIEGFDRVCRGEGSRIVDFFLSGDTAVFYSALIDEDIDTLPDMTGVTGYEFGRGVPFLEGYKLIPYGHSRGCPYHCSFCEVKNLPKALRIKTNIKRDLALLQQAHDPDMFYFMDETLPYYDAGWRRQFDGNAVPFLAFIRADIQLEHLKFLVSNGMIACAMGIESGDEDYRNSVLNKGVTNGQIYQTVDHLDSYQVDRIMLYMRNTPGETPAMQDKTFDMVDRLGGHSMIFEYEVL